MQKKCNCNAAKSDAYGCLFGWVTRGRVTSVNGNVNAIGMPSVAAGARLSALKHFCCLGDFNNAALHRFKKRKKKKEEILLSCAFGAVTIWPQFASSLIRHGQIDNWCSPLGLAWPALGWLFNPAASWAAQRKRDYQFHIVAFPRIT